MSAHIPLTKASPLAELRVRTSGTMCCPEWHADFHGQRSTSGWGEETGPFWWLTTITNLTVAYTGKPSLTQLSFLWHRIYDFCVCVDMIMWENVRVAVERISCDCSFDGTVLQIADLPSPPPPKAQPELSLSPFLPFADHLLLDNVPNQLPPHQ